MKLPIIHFKGFHFPLFPRLWPVRGVMASFRFTESCRYNLDNGDQFDWNKLCGVNFTLPGQPLKAVMLGWRYDPESDYIVIAPYINDPELGRMMFPPLARVLIGYSFPVRISRTKSGRWRFAAFINDEWQEEFYEVSFKNEWGRDVAGWYGGNRPAPHFIKIERVA